MDTFALVKEIIKLVKMDTGIAVWLFLSCQINTRIMKEWMTASN